MSDEVTPPEDEVQALRSESLAAAVEERSPESLLPSPPDPIVGEPPDSAPSVTRESPPNRPEGAAVNGCWNLAATPRAGGLRGKLESLVRRLLAPLIESQTTFNSRQVQLDNQMLEYMDARFDQTHRHYDRILGLYGNHLQDADQRHVQLERELVTHVHDVVKRIDLVLAHGERSRVELEAALRIVRSRLGDLEARFADVKRVGSPGPGRDD